MTKLFPLIFLCLFLMCTVINAQSPAGSFYLSTGIGLAPTYTGKNVSSDFPTISFEVGYRISQSFSLNAFAGYTAASSDPTFSSDGLASQVSNKTTMFGLKGQLHRNFTDKIEVYGGAALGYAAVDKTETNATTGELITRNPDMPTPFDPEAKNGQFLYSGFVGGKYWVRPKIACYSEIGVGISLFTVGASFRL